MVPVIARLTVFCTKIPKKNDCSCENSGPRSPDIAIAKTPPSRLGSRSPAVLDGDDGGKDLG